MSCQATELLTVSADIEFAADERLALPPDEQRWHPWAWGAALLLHALAIFILLFFHGKPALEEPQSPPGVAVVFDNGGEPQNAAPPAPLKGPSTSAQIPPPPPPPPPQQAAQAEVNLNMPESPLATLQNVPEAQSQPQPQRQPAARPQPRPAPPHYAMMLNGMSYGNTSPASPPAPNARRGLNLSLPQTEAQAANTPELAIKGEIGADWEAALDRWVEAHKYYPQAAIEQDQQGSVKIEFTVDRAGNVTGLHLLNGSGSPFLDQAWLGLFAQNRLPQFPPGTKSDHITVDATMHFELIH